MVTKWHEGQPAEWVTVAESEYDVNERDHWEALDEYEAALCPQCKQLRSVCRDPQQPWFPQRHQCHATTARAMAQRRFAKRHEKTQPDADGWHPGDGTIVWVAAHDLTPDDDFLGSAAAELGTLADRGNEHE